MQKQDLNNLLNVNQNYFKHTSCSKLSQYNIAQQQKIFPINFKTKNYSPVHCLIESIFNWNCIYIKFKDTNTKILKDLNKKHSFFYKNIILNETFTELNNLSI